MLHPLMLKCCYASILLCPPPIPAVLAHGLAVHGSLYPLTAKEGDQQARDGEENPQQQIDKPAEEKPVENAVMLVFHNGYRLNVDV